MRSPDEDVVGDALPDNRGLRVRLVVRVPHAVLVAPAPLDAARVEVQALGEGDSEEATALVAQRGLLRADHGGRSLRRLWAALRGRCRGRPRPPGGGRRRPSGGGGADDRPPSGRVFPEGPPGGGGGDGPGRAVHAVAEVVGADARVYAAADLPEGREGAGKAGLPERDGGIQ